MKKIITLALGVVAMLTSCQKEDIGATMNPTTDQVTINLVADDAAATRAVITASTAPTRYIVEAYSDAAYTTAANIFGEGDGATNQSTITPTNGTASLTLPIDRTKDYYFLFWSDVNGADAYTTTTLKSVTLKSGKNPVESWSGKAEILKGTAKPTLSVTLKRAVAEIRLMENGKIPAGSSLMVAFYQSAQFNVADGAVATRVGRTEIIENSGAVDGTTDRPVPLNSTKPIYVFATQVEGAQTVVTLIMLRMTIGNETDESFEVNNVPIEANHKTNITGHYTQMTEETFNVSVDDTWASPDNDVNKDPVIYAVGDTYPKGATGSAIQGVVYSISNGGANGMVVSLDEVFCAWSFEYLTTTAIDRANGRKNMATIVDGNLTLGYYPPFEWVHNAKNGGTASYSDDAKGVWYLPALDELVALYGSSGATKATVNATLRGISGADQLSTYYYWSSTEDRDDGAWYMNFDYGGRTSYGDKGIPFSVRAVLAF